ncbi:class II aldolase/adducin domain-containing protein [Meredithblackwellia eburnea MCA 4105]
MVQMPVVLPDPTQAFDFGDGPPSFDDPLEERKYLKERLACAYRIFAKLNLLEGASGHLTVRDPVDKDAFWVTPYGKQWALMKASDLLLVDKEGKVVMGGKPGKQIVNTSALVIHAAIHEARSDVNAVCHSHSPYGKAFSAMRRPLPYYTQDACLFFNDLAVYNSFGGVVVDSDESQKIVKALGSKKAAILASHGLLTTGGSIESATAWFINLENECRTTILAESGAAMDPRNKPVEIGEEEAKFTHAASGFDKAGWFDALPWFELIEAESNGDYKN